MNETVSNFSFGGNKFLPEIHLGQPGFTYSKFIYINRRFMIYLGNELHKAYFQHDMAYGDFKDLTKRTVSDKILCDKAYKNPKYDVYQRGLASMVYKLFDKKKLLVVVIKMRICQTSN